MKTVAILGATGYIGKSLASEFYKVEESYGLFLFSRTLPLLESVMHSEVKISENSHCKFSSLEAFGSGSYDVILNCTGMSGFSAIEKDPKSIFTITEEMDEFIFSYLNAHPETLYINMSSGSVEHPHLCKLTLQERTALVAAGGLDARDYYSIAKINAEELHRKKTHLNIVDVRVFSFFSRFINEGSHFLMAQIMSSLKNKKIFETDENDIVRDYVCSEDLFSLITLIIKKGKINDFFSAYSKGPTSKMNLLVFLATHFYLQVAVKENEKKDIQLKKNEYFPVSKKAEILGYHPKFDSLAGIEHELKKAGL